MAKKTDKSKKKQTSEEKSEKSSKQKQPTGSENEQDRKSQNRTNPEKEEGQHRREKQRVQREADREEGQERQERFEKFAEEVDKRFRLQKELKLKAGPGLKKPVDKDSIGSTPAFTYGKKPPGQKVFGGKSSLRYGDGPKTKIQRGRIRHGRIGGGGRKYTAPKGKTVVVKSKFIRAGKNSRESIIRHATYLQERERGEKEPERKFFDRYRDGVEREEVEEKMLTGRGSRAAMHTIILSPDENTIDLQDYTRQSLKALEDRLGHEVDWYAIEHRNTDHYHVHVMIAGKIPGAEQSLEERAPFRRRDLDMKWGRKESDVRELLGDGYDERAVKDPREERQEDWTREGGEREPTDPDLKDLLDGSERSLSELRTEKMLDRVERRLALEQTAKDRGDLFLDRFDLKEIRDAGNDYIERNLSLDKELEMAIDREMQIDLVGLETTLEPEREIDKSEGTSQESERDRDDDNLGRGLL